LSDHLKELFNRLYLPLCNYATVFLKDRQAAEDVVQNVFIQLWENDALNQLENPDPYLLRAVKYKCIDYIRSQKTKKEVLMNDLPEIGKEEDHSLKEEDILPLISYFTAKLPPKMQQVFRMSREQGLSYKEIAAVLNISIKTVENQMSTALKKLRVLLKEHNFLPLLLLFLQ